MNCPVDGTSLQMTERQGVEIDYCPRCRGVWLDRGELDKVIERASVQERPPEGPFYPATRDEGRGGEHRYDDDRDFDRRYDDDHDRRRYGDDRGDDRYRRRKKRESFLEDLFDFG